MLVLGCHPLQGSAAAVWSRMPPLPGGTKETHPATAWMGRRMPSARPRERLGPTQGEGSPGSRGPGRPRGRTGTLTPTRGPQAPSPRDPHPAPRTPRPRAHVPRPPSPSWPRPRAPKDAQEKEGRRRSFPGPPPRAAPTCPGGLGAPDSPREREEGAP